MGGRQLDITQRETYPSDEGIKFKMGPEEIARVWLIRFFSEPREWEEKDAESLAKIIQEVWDSGCEEALRHLRRQGRVRD